MRIPTYKAIKKVFPDYTEENHKEFKRLLNGPLDGSTSRERECHNSPENWDVALHYLNDVLEGYGIDGWAFPGQYEEGFSYINFGDTYTETICYRSDESQRSV